MSRVLEGTYRAGKIELNQPVTGIAENTTVSITIVESSAVDLRDLGVDEAQAAEARARLATFAEDWDSPAMSAYDDYDAARRQQNR